MALLLFVIVGSFFFIFDVFLDLPYVATKKEKITTIIKLAQIKKVEDSEQSRRTKGLIEHERPEVSRRRETVVDLGSGDGRLLFAAVAKGAKAIGYEINPFLIFLTKLKLRFVSPQLRDLISLKKENFWGADLKVADVIFVYGRQKTMPKFEDFVFKNAQRGTRVVVNTNPFPNKKPIKIKNKIFLYKV